MKKSLEIVLIFVSFLIINFCSDKKENELDLNRSKRTKQSISFENDLVIHNENWFPTNLAVDKEENIYVFDEYVSTIYKFDKQGKNLFKREFTKGQGPGKFNFMDPDISSDGKLYIYDKLTNMLSILDKECNILETKRVEKDLFLLNLDSENNLFFWKQHGMYNSSSKYYRKNTLTKFSLESKKNYMIYEYTRLYYSLDLTKSVFYFPLFTRYGTYKLDSDDFIYCAVSDKYEISIFNQERELVQEITSNQEIRNVTEKDIERFKPEIPQRTSYKTDFVIPEKMPSIADIFILRNRYVLVITFQSDFDEKILLGDLFDNYGTYITQVQIPKYYLWDGLFFGVKKNALVKKDKFYTIESSEFEEEFYVKRYLINWITD